MLRCQKYFLYHIKIILHNGQHFNCHFKALGYSSKVGRLGSAEGSRVGIQGEGPSWECPRKLRSPPALSRRDCEHTSKRKVDGMNERRGSGGFPAGGLLEGISSNSVLGGEGN